MTMTLTAIALLILVISVDIYKSKTRRWGENRWKELSTFTKFTKLNTYYGGMSYDNLIKKSSLLWKSY